MPTDNQQLQTVPSESIFSLQAFEHGQRIAKMIASSSLIPSEYQGRVDNVMIAMEMANRMNISPLMVMQNLYIVKGKPGWAGKFVIAIINGSKRFTELEFELSGEGDNYGYTAYAMRDGKRVDGTKVDWKMVKGEGWLDKPGSKWKTMPEQMFRYRAAAFFGNVHTPDLLMGMQTSEEIIDITTVINEKVDKEHERMVKMIEQAETVEDLDKLGEHITAEQVDLFDEKRTKLKAQKK